MKKCLLYAPPSALAEPHFGILMEEAECLYHEGNEVYFAYCDGLHHYCSVNPHGDRLFCKLCRSCAKKWLRKNLSPEIKLIPMKRQGTLPQNHWDYKTVKDVKSIIYQNTYIGYGVMSTYTSSTRDPEPDFTDESVRRYFDFALNHAVYLTDNFYKLCDEIKPDSISIYNGRPIDNRPFYDYAMYHHIPLRNNEVIGGPRANEQFSRIIYENHLPHSIPYNTELLRKVWAMPNESEEEKVRKGRDFFERRRKGVPAGDRVYIGNQKKGLLPAGWDENKRNIVIFNSSEDEFSAVGKEFDDYALFSTQYEGIVSILEMFSSSEEYHFYLRVHPNLAKVQYKYHTDLYELPKKYKNLTVIAATDPCSTYDLLDAAEKVIVFGSTMGAESVYWGKPTILLAGAFYYLLDICYTPKNTEELRTYIEQHLEAKPEMGAIQYGYYLLNRKLLTIPAKYVDYSVKDVKIGPYILFVCNYARIFGSLKIQKIVRTFLAWLAKKRKRIKLPRKTFVDHTFKRS